MTFLLDMWLLIISQVKLNLSRFSFVIWLCDHLINRLCDFVDNKPALEPTTLSSFLAIVIVEVEIGHVISWSPGQSVKSLDGWWSFIINLYLPSLAVVAFGEVEIYRFVFVTWLHVATGSQSHVTLRVSVKGSLLW